jgi:phosphatidate cytidylyltransferase
MLAQRTLVAVLLLPVALLAIYTGGLFFYTLILLVLVISGWEYSKLFQGGGSFPAWYLIIAGVLLLAGGRAAFGFKYTPVLISLVILVNMAFYVLKFERGDQQAGVDFTISTAGTLYIGWLGSYLISLRDLPEGMWWAFIVLPAVWIADTAAYFLGKRFGRNHMTPRLSPKKTWEGFIAGIIAAVIGSALIASVIGSLTGRTDFFSPITGAVYGLLIGSISVFGDLGISMFKRQFGVKDTGQLLPGHGGILDRIDSWIWAVVLGYYLVLLFTGMIL